MNDISFIALAIFGAITMELVHWYELRNKLEEEDTQKLIKSKYYWIITMSMIVISGFGTYILFFEKALKMSIPFVLGAAFPTIFRKVVESSQSRDLGNNNLSGTKLTFRKVFKAYIR